MWQKHLAPWNDVVISTALWWALPSGFCAEDYSNHFMQVTWCMMTYLHACNELSFTRTRRVRKWHIAQKVLATSFELHVFALVWHVTIAFEAQYRLMKNLSKNGPKMEQDLFSRPFWPPRTRMGAPLDAPEHEKVELLSSCFDLGTLRISFWRLITA